MYFIFVHLFVTCKWKRNTPIFTFDDLHKNTFSVDLWMSARLYMDFSKQGIV